MAKKVIPFALIGFFVLDENEKFNISVKTELTIDDLKDIEDLLESKLLASHSMGKIVIYPALIPPKEVEKYLSILKENAGMVNKSINNREGNEDVKTTHSSA